MRSLYKSYLTRIDHITTLYSVISLNEQIISFDPDSLDDSLEIPLSTNFGSWATIKNKRDILNSIKSGQLHQINCYQAVVSLVSNFEDLVEQLAKHFSITDSEIKIALPVNLREGIESPIIKKIHAIHSKLSIDSNVVGSHESAYYYKIIKVRNCIVHRRGIPNNSELELLQNWITDGSITFDRDHIDDFVHFFLMPVKSMILEIDQKLSENVVQPNSY